MAPETSIYPVIFTVPNELADTPIPFSKQAIYDEDENLTGYHSYNSAVAAGIIAPRPTPAIHDGVDEDGNPIKVSTHFQVQSGISNILTFGAAFIGHLLKVAPTMTAAMYTAEADVDGVDNLKTVWMALGDPSEEYCQGRFESESAIFVPESEEYDEEEPEL